MPSPSLSDVRHFSESLEAAILAELKRRDADKLVRNEKNPKISQVIHPKVVFDPATDSVVARVTISIEAKRSRSFSFRVPRDAINDDQLTEAIWEAQQEKFDDLDPFISVFQLYLERRRNTTDAYTKMLTEWDAVEEVMDRDKPEDVGDVFSDVDFAMRQMEKAQLEDEEVARKEKAHAIAQKRQREDLYQRDPMSGLF